MLNEVGEGEQKMLRRERESPCYNQGQKKGPNVDLLYLV